MMHRPSLSTRIFTWIANSVFLVLLLCIGTVAYWAWDSYGPPATTDIAWTRFTNPESSIDVRVNEPISLTSLVTRGQDCRFESERVFRRFSDKREISIQTTIRNIGVEDVNKPTEVTYTIVLQPQVLNLGEPYVDGEIFGRIQFFCNGLDYAIPRFYINPKTGKPETPSVRVRVYPPAEAARLRYGIR